MAGGWSLAFLTAFGNSEKLHTSADRSSTKRARRTSYYKTLWQKASEDQLQQQQQQRQRTTLSSIEEVLADFNGSSFGADYLILQKGSRLQRLATDGPGDLAALSSDASEQQAGREALAGLHWEPTDGHAIRLAFPILG